ncbi:MAG: nitrile hydratase subunit beta, partial [Rhizobiales bacterium]|nr:nitrile hydratase subunit beta [Hyphomicrobiales bacterium]
EGEDPQWLYSVRFKATELWGDGANRNDHVHVDCWEPYLERV